LETVGIGDMFVDGRDSLAADQVMVEFEWFSLSILTVRVTFEARPQLVAIETRPPTLCLIECSHCG
jgi:hypothetical protein